MSVGNGRNCIVCGKQVVTSLRPPYCHNCDPELKRRLTEAKLEAADQKREGDRMGLGDKRNCIVCGTEVVTRIMPPYCHDCDPALRSRLEDAKREAAYQKREAWERARREATPTPTQAITPDEYVRLAMRTECEELEPLARMCPFDGDPLLPIRLVHALLGVSGEAGELSENVKKWVFYGRPLDRQEMKEELGDLLWYVALACDALGVPLSEVMEANISKLQSRFPEKFTTEKANSRDTVAEKEAMGRTVPYPPGYDPEVCVTCRYNRSMLSEDRTCAGTNHQHSHTFVKESQLEQAVREREKAVAARECIREKFEKSVDSGGTREMRTRSQVIAQQDSFSGCCDKNVDQTGCDCLDNALPDEEDPLHRGG